MSCDCDLVKRLEADIDAARKKPFFFFLLSLHPDLKSFRLFSISLCFVKRGTPNRIRTLRFCVVSCLSRPDSH